MKKNIIHQDPAVEHRPLSAPKQRLREVLRQRIADHRARKASGKKESGNA